ncbi:hypothetical protein ACFX14_019413 [Malus domestica]
MRTVRKNPTKKEIRVALARAIARWTDFSIGLDCPREEVQHWVAREPKQARAPEVRIGRFFENVALYTSWVEVTHDAIIGNEMQLREMLSLIHTSFLEKIGGKRTKESISNRWKLLSQWFSTWRDALTQVSGNL